MKTNKKIVVALATLLLAGAANTVNAKSWRIHNLSAFAPNFTSINEAMESEQVQDGDTIYLDPGCILTSEQRVTKRVTVIGPGYFMKERTYGIAFINHYLYMQTEGSKVEGVRIDHLVIAANLVTVERCRINNQIYASGNNAQMATIRQCYLMNGNSSIHISGHGTNDVRSALWRIENCLLDGYYDHSIRDLYQATIVNNYIQNTYDGGTMVFERLGDCVITDNIIVKTRENQKNNIFGSLATCSVQNNILSCDEGTYPDYPYNVCMGSSDMSSVFTLESDDVFSLVADSPAAGNGSNGTDIGPTGGQFPYVASGRPYGLPWYPQTMVATAPKDGKVNVKLQIKAQDE